MSAIVKDSNTIEISIGDTITDVILPQSTDLVSLSTNVLYQDDLNSLHSVRSIIQNAKDLRINVNGSWIVELDKNVRWLLQFQSGVVNSTDTLVIHQFGKLTIKGGIEILDAETRYWKNITFIFASASDSAFSQNQGLLQSSGEVDIQSMLLITASPVHIQSGSFSATGVTFSIISRHLASNSSKGLPPQFRVFIQITLKNCIIAASFNFFQKPVLEGSVSHGENISLVMNNKSNQASVGFDDHTLLRGFSTLLGSRLELLGFTRTIIVNSSIGSSNRFYLRNFTGETTRSNGVLIFQELSIRSKFANTAVSSKVSFTDFDSNVRTTRNKYFDRSLSPQNFSDVEYTQLANQDMSLDVDYDFLTDEIVTVFLANVHAFQNSPSNNVTANNRNDFRFSSSDKITAYIRHYGAQLKEFEFVARSNIQISVETELVENSLIEKTLAEVAALIELSNFNEVFDYAEYLEFTENSWRLLDGYSKKIVSNEGFELFISGSYKVKNVTPSSSVAPVILLNNIVEISTSRLTSGNISKITFFGEYDTNNIETRAIYEYRKEVDSVVQTFKTNRLVAQRSQVVIDYSFDFTIQIFAMQGTMSTLLYTFEDVTEFDKYIEFEDVYDVFFIEIFGSTVKKHQASFSMLNETVLFQVTEFEDAVEVAQWLVDFKNQVRYGVLTENNTKISYLGSSSFQNITGWQFVWITREIIEKHNKVNPSNHLKFTDYVNIAAGGIVVEKEILNNEIKSLYITDTSYSELTVQESNVSLLSIDVGIPLRTTSKYSLIISGLKQNDVLAFQQTNDASTFSIIYITATTHFLILTFGVSYTMQVKRYAKNSSSFNIIDQSEYNFVETAIQLDGIALSYSDSSDISELFSIVNDEIVLKKDAILNSDSIELAREKCVFFILSLDMSYPFHFFENLLKDLKSGLMTLRVNMKAEDSRVVNYSILLLNGFIATISQYSKYEYLLLDESQESSISDLQNSGDEITNGSMLKITRGNTIEYLLVSSAAFLGFVPFVFADMTISSITSTLNVSTGLPANFAMLVGVFVNTALGEMKVVIKASSHVGGNHETDSLTLAHYPALNNLSSSELQANFSNNTQITLYSGYGIIIPVKNITNYLTDAFIANSSYTYLQLPLLWGVPSRFEGLRVHKSISFFATSSLYVAASYSDDDRALALNRGNKIDNLFNNIPESHIFSLLAEGEENLFVSIVQVIETQVRINNLIIDVFAIETNAQFQNVINDISAISTSRTSKAISYVEEITTSIKIHLAAGETGNGPTDFRGFVKGAFGSINPSFIFFHNRSRELTQLYYSLASGLVFNFVVLSGEVVTDFPSKIIVRFNSVSYELELQTWNTSSVTYSLHPLT